MIRFFPLVALCAALMTVSCQPLQHGVRIDPVYPTDVTRHYVALAQAVYGDSLATARELQVAVATFLDSPSPNSHAVAKAAWVRARVPYQQSEAFRFGNPVVDDWEGKVNAWPLDEGLIDYTAPAYGRESDTNYFYTANIIANPALDIGGIQVDASEITPELLSHTLHEIDGVDANVATGYHAIEFLLWGQDLNGTGPGAGQRQWTDYSLESCTNDHCDRRRDYLEVATALLVSDLEEMAASWAQGGEAFLHFSRKNEDQQLLTILTGMGSLANAELAQERVRLGLLLNDPEEEHDCFSDNTHNSHYYDALGIENVYRGSYVRIDGSRVQGPGLYHLVHQLSQQQADAMDAAMLRTHDAMSTLVSEAESGRPYDMLIAPGNIQGEVIVSEVVDALVAETRQVESIIGLLGLTNISLGG